MTATLLSLIFLLLFAEIASANFKRLAPVLEAWEQSKKSAGAGETEPAKFFWLGGWEKLAAAVWALGVSIPLIAFALACYLFLEDPAVKANMIIGSAVGGNGIGLSLGFGLILVSGPITFFRVRSITSPVFLLLATIAFIFTCLNYHLSVFEGMLLLLLLAAYGLYFRRFSSEWKSYERAFARQSLVDSSEGILPVIALLCMGLGFFLLAVLVSYPFVRELGGLAANQEQEAMKIGAYLVAIVLYLPWLIRCLWASRAGATAKAIMISSISHSCLLNVLLLSSLAAILGAQDLAPSLISVHLPALFIFTGIFVATLLIEKEKGGLLPWYLFLFYLAYVGAGVLL